MQEEGFDYLVTSDKNLQYQQNIEKYTVSFIVLNVNKREFWMLLNHIEA